MDLGETIRSLPAAIVLLFPSGYFKRFHVILFDNKTVFKIACSTASCTWHHSAVLTCIHRRVYMDPQASTQVSFTKLKRYSAITCTRRIGAQAAPCLWIRGLFARTSHLCRTGTC